MSYNNMARGCFNIGLKKKNSDCEPDFAALWSVSSSKGQSSLPEKPHLSGSVELHVHLE